MPKFAHLPLILKPDGNGKLSKRDGDRLGFPVFPLEWKDPKTNDISSGYREKDYFSEAFINMLAFLGWNPGNEKVYLIDELISDFSIKRVGKSGAKFDPEKAKWFNQQHLRLKSNSELGILMKQNCSYDVSEDYLEKVAELNEGKGYFSIRINFRKILFESVDEYDEKTFRKKMEI